MIDFLQPTFDGAKAADIRKSMKVTDGASAAAAGPTAAGGEAGAAELEVMKRGGLQLQPLWTVPAAAAS